MFSFLLVSCRVSFRFISRSIAAKIVITFQNLSECSAVLRKCLPARFGDLNVGLRLIADKRFCDRNVAGLFQLMQVRAQVAISKFKSIFHRVEGYLHIWGKYG